MNMSAEWVWVVLSDLSGFDEVEVAHECRRAEGVGGDWGIRRHRTNYSGGGNVTRGEKCGTYYTAEESQDYQSYSAYGFQEGESTP